jgi:Gram-negative bacterial TonB protein C-terminal
MNITGITVSFLLLFIGKENFAQQTPVADTAIADTTIFKKVEIEADFPGGVQAWKKYLEKNLNAAVPGEKGAPDGMYQVMVEFVVNKIGWVSDIKPITSHGYGMEQEVMRIIKKSGAWNPAIQDGRPVKAYRKQPVTFVIQSDHFSVTSNVPYTIFTNTENELIVEAAKVKSKDLRLTISHGTISPAGDGKYIARVSKTGRVIIELFKKSTSIGKISFEVKAQ